MKKKIRVAILWLGSITAFFYLLAFLAGLDRFEVTHEGGKYECRDFVDVSDVWEKRGAGHITVNTVRIKRRSDGKCSDMHGPRIYGKTFSEVQDIIESLNTKSVDYCYTMCISEY